MPTWRSALNKVAGTILRACLKKAASTASAAALLLCTTLIVTVAPTGAQAPAGATAEAAQPGPKPPPKPKPLDKPLWASLTASQKIALAPIADEWDQADGVRKQKWLEIANRFASMKPDEQARVHARMRDLFKMSPEERRVVRENYTRAKKIDPTQKSEEWEKYQQLPEEKKKQLADETASARTKKQVANLPSASQSTVETVAPIKRAPPLGGCAPGTVKNTAAAVGAAPCVPTPAAAVPAAPAAPIAPAAPVNPIPTAPAPAPSAAPNAK